MADRGKPIPAWVFKHMLKLHREGRTTTEIARLTGTARNTVIKYLRDATGRDDLGGLAV